MLSSYRLNRIPQDASLQAWNAADELFLKRHHSTLPLGNLLLINDHFGALAIALAEKSVNWWHYSTMSAEALRMNCELNNIPEPVILNGLVQEINKYQTIVIQIPKSTNLFAWQLEQAIQHMPDNARVYALGMVKHISAGHIAVMNTLFKDSNPGRAEKKARVIELWNPTRTIKSKTHFQSFDRLPCGLANLPGCYAEKTVDQGALVFIEHFGLLPDAHNVLDLGCGNGVLSLIYAQQHPHAHLSLVDENHQALQSAEINFKNSKLSNEFKLVHSNSLNSVPDCNFDLILCNPPFHQENTVTDSIAKKMFADAHNALTNEGELWIVANRHLPYHEALRKYFRTTQIKSSHPKFNVICCKKG
ncbi:class I SAM-dependent methyltransferase [Reinekea sp. G2M2-21]|uniref:class I SAM-dependent methyltransferase n=1 Tax=Reinekea sp. G2M2-21 TaxID=2788942 RepID=UPI0018AA3783